MQEEAGRAGYLEPLEPKVSVQLKDSVILASLPVLMIWLRQAVSLRSCIWKPHFPYMCNIFRPRMRAPHFLGLKWGTDPTVVGHSPLRPCL